MGTRSTITFYEKWNDTEKPILCVRQQYDGYIDCVGKDLARWLTRRKLINGIQNETDTEGYANGIGCLLAQFVRDHKTEIGYFYITSVDINKEFIDYNYKVVIKDDVGDVDDLTTITVTNWDNEESIFEGKPSELLLYEPKDEDE